MSRLPPLRLLALLMLPAMAAPAPARSGDAWIRALPGNGRSGCCFGLAPDSGGGAWFTAALGGADTLAGNTLVPAGGTDVLLVRMGADGVARTAVVAGGPDRDAPRELAGGPEDSAYLVAKIDGEARFDDSFLPNVGRTESVLARYDAGGRCLWAQKVPGSGEESVQSVAAAPDGAAVVTGTYVRKWSGDDPDVYLEKFAPDGARLWIRRAEGTGRAVDVAVDGEGNVYLAGASPREDSGEQPSVRYEQDGWPLLQCFDARGTHRWTWIPGHEARTLRDEVEATGVPAPAPPRERSWGRAVAVAANAGGGCWVLGEIRGLVRVGEVTLPGLRDRDVFLVRLDADGELVWTERVGGPHDDGAFDVAVHADGTCAVTGAFRGTATFDPWTVTGTGETSAFVAVFDAHGSCAWVQPLAGPGEGAGAPSPFEVAIGPDHEIWLAGWYGDTLRIGGLELPAGGDGHFLARLPAGGRTR